MHGQLQRHGDHADPLPPAGREVDPHATEAQGTTKATCDSVPSASPAAGGRLCHRRWHMRLVPPCNTPSLPPPQGGGTSMEAHPYWMEGGHGGGLPPLCVKKVPGARRRGPSRKEGGLIKGPASKGLAHSNVGVFAAVKLGSEIAERKAVR